MSFQAHTAPLKSCLYRGSVHHQRHAPRPHVFHKRLFMMYLDLAELPELFARYWLWSARRPAPAWFRRADYHGDPAVSLDQAVRDHIETHSGVRPRGPIRLLTHLRYFGYNFNPVSFYYVFDPSDSYLETIVAEITNTPWKERHSYVLPSVRGGALEWCFEKRFHVSPFMPMQQRYRWRLSVPGDSLMVHMQNQEAGKAVFEASMHLRREAISSGSLARALIGFPLMTVQVILMIHWEALRLAIKRIPYFAHRPG